MMQEKLLKPFPENNIEWRVSRAGYKKDGSIWAIVLPYVTSRAIMQRLDSAVGCDGWKDELLYVAEGFISTIYIKDGAAEWIGKSDVAPMTQVESFKGGASDAFKRAAVKWGIGRYLYYLDQVFYADVSENGKNTGSFKTQDKKTVYFKWDEPSLPKWAVAEENQIDSIPEELQEYFRKLKFTKGEVKAFCDRYEWDFSLMKMMVNQQEDNPS